MKFTLRNSSFTTSFAALLAVHLCIFAKPSTAAEPPEPAVLINAITRNETVAEAPIQLAKDGEALLPIIISPKAGNWTKSAAEDLQDYLGRIAGAKFEVKTGDGTSGIVLGSQSDFPTPALEKALEIRANMDGREAYAIRTQANRVLLLGATDLGASHAAYRMLDELGVRWFTPHPVWEVVPSTPDLKWNLNITDRPQILSRNVWFQAQGTIPSLNAEYNLWKQRNSHTESFVVNAGHNLFVIPTAFAEEFKAHPEYYAVDDKGNIIPDDIELTNPAVRKLVVEYARRVFKNSPNADMVSIDPTDRAVHSQRPEALAIPYSDQIFGLANEVAQMLQKEFPGKMVGLYSYNAHYDPPSFPLEPNVHVQMTSMSVAPKYTGPERARLWALRSTNLGVYEYYSVFAWGADGLIGTYVNDVREQQRHIRDDLVGKNVVSLSGEATSSWGSLGRGYYITNKLLWNPNLDLDKLLEDYYEKAFGPAAPAMRKYFDRLDPGNKPLMSAHLLGLVFKDMDEATKLAKDRPDVMARLDQLKMFLYYRDFVWRKQGEGQQLSDDFMMENLWRTSDLHLTAWPMIVQSWGSENYPKGDIAAWPKKKPYTHEEIEDLFQESVKYYAPRIREIGPRLKFSEDLVPVKLPNQKPIEGESKQVYQGTMQYALYSVNGKPLRFTTEAGDAWGYKTSYKVTDREGNIIAEGKPEAKVLVTHEIAVPRPGLYTLTYIDPGAYWTFTAQPEQPYSIVMLAEKYDGRAAQILPQMYFYVPKGTKKIEYFPTNPHYLIGPDGSVQWHVQPGQANDYISVPVPEGMDGTCWSFLQLEFGKIHFWNVPSYLAPSPGQLLIPREVAEKDGLEILK